jgi:hypothetical protein
MTERKLDGWDPHCRERKLGRSAIQGCIQTFRSISKFRTPFVISECNSLLGWCRPESTEDVEHSVGNQLTSAGESSRTIEEHARPSGTTDQSNPMQQRAELMPTAEEPSAASGGTMGVVVVEESGAGNPATKALAAEGAVTEEEAEIEEIICPKEEKVAPQCVRVARKQGDE